MREEKAAFASWLGKQHLNFDRRLAEVIYLPEGSPGDQVRLLEVNTGLYVEPGSSLSPVEVTPAVTDLPFKVWVLDVTPDEWGQIQANPVSLPAGWDLKNRMTIRRQQ